MSDATTEPLKLLACDVEDLSVIASLTQDALAPLADMTFLVGDRQFIVALNRFKWETVDEGPPYARTHAGLRFDHVTGVQRKGIDPEGDRDRVLDLLTIAYADGEGDGPGTVLLQFADDKAIRLTVERLEAALEDLGAPWPTRWKPGHEEAETV